MLRLAVVAILFAAAAAQNLEACSSGGPEFWCSSCENAEACSALIPGLVDYCQQIGIFSSGQCDGAGPDPVDPTLPPTTVAPTEFDGDDGSKAEDNIKPVENPETREDLPFEDDPPLYPPFINIQPVNITVPPGATAQFKCAATGGPAPVITISLKTEALSNYKPPTEADRQAAIASATSSDLSSVNVIQEIEDVSEEHEGWYTCLATNVQGAVYSDAYLRVLDLCATISCDAPKICEADYILGTAECVCPECDTNFDVVCGMDCNTYFNPCQLDQLNCQEGTDIGIWTKGMCPAIEKPVIISTTFDKGQTDGGMKLKDLTVTSIHKVNEGDDFTLSCTATGAPEPIIEWYLDEELVFTGAEFIISSATPSHEGKYQCRASNCVGATDNNLNIQGSEGIEVIVEPVEDGGAIGIPCQVFGDPHIVTFDNKIYDYMGDCNYVLSMDCDWGEWVVYGNFKQCGPKDLGYPASCLVDVTVFWNSIGLNLQRGWIVVYRGEKVPLKMKGTVYVEDIAIGYDGLYITVTLPNGIKITWDGIISTQVILPPDSARNTCGLCGNNDKDNTNEFQARFSNVDSDNINTFGNSWEIDRMDVCPAIEDELLAEEWCAMYPDRAAEGDVRCPEVFENAVFDDCRAFLATEPYVEKCRYDFCALDEMREILLADCGVAAAYVAQCKALSGITIPASRWRSAVNCPTVAEHQNATVAEGCPQDQNPWTIV